MEFGLRQELVMNGLAAWIKGWHMTEGQMNAASNSTSNFGRQMAESILAIALALPVIFAFNEARVTWLARGVVLPESANRRPTLSGEQAADRVSLSEVPNLGVERGGQRSTSASGVIVGPEGISLTANRGLKVGHDAQVQLKHGETSDKVEMVAKSKRLSRHDTHLARTWPFRGYKKSRKGTHDAISKVFDSGDPWRMRSEPFGHSIE